MSGALAYHAVVLALESKGNRTPARRFAESIQHALTGHLPYQRYLDAGLACVRRRRGEDAIEWAVREQLQLDLNPLTVANRCTVRPEIALRSYNEYNERVNLGVRTQLRTKPLEVPDRRMVVGRKLVAATVDPKPCQQATYFGFELLLRQVLRNAHSRQKPQITRMSEVARHLGLDRSVLLEASLALEALGYIPIPELAKALGCHQRTLERRLRGDGLTAEMLRQTARLLHALERIAAGDSLAEVAVDAGFSDQPHMARMFKASCGMPPSFFKSLLASGTSPM